jgi:hypothetical protein
VGAASVVVATVNDPLVRAPGASERELFRRMSEDCAEEKAVLLDWLIFTHHR